jgi:hypothetical protein
MFVVLHRRITSVSFCMLNKIFCSLFVTFCMNFSISFLPAIVFDQIIITVVLL